MRKIRRFSFIQTGFTLIEILIALAVFAILATITASSMFYAFNTRARVTLQADRLITLQLAITIIERDTQQSTNRPVRGNEMRLFPAFIGQENYLEFTRSGVVNPNSQEKRSTLQRIALLCSDNQLVRRSWQSLDSSNRDKYEDKVLLNDLVKCQFAYLNQTLQVLSEWRENALGQNQQSEPLPKALQLSLSLKDRGKLDLLFIFPEALYANNK